MICGSFTFNSSFKSDNNSIIKEELQIIFRLKMRKLTLVSLNDFPKALISDSISPAFWRISHDS